MTASAAATTTLCLVVDLQRRSDVVTRIDEPLVVRVLHVEEVLHPAALRVSISVGPARGPHRSKREGDPITG
jgi:hypothetical protein